MGIREWILRPYFWWKARRKKRQQSKIVIKQQEPTIDSKDTWPYLSGSTKKVERLHEIAAKNRERQRNTMSSGLKSSNFRPRPAFEKRLYDLTKKPGDSEDD